MSFISPFNGKIFKSQKALDAHIAYMKSDDAVKNTIRLNRNLAIKKTETCEFCNLLYSKGNIDRHRRACAVIKTCPVCSDSFKGNSVTCSYACSNKHFRSGPNNGMWKESNYRTTCFYYHEPKCVVCNEDKIVEVHHLDENHSNNNPSNLIPLCPTHHQYWHSRYKNLVEPIIISYIKNWMETK